MLSGLSAPASSGPVSGGLMREGLVPLAAVVFAGVLAHYLTANPNDERGLHS